MPIITTIRGTLKPFGKARGIGLTSTGGTITTAGGYRIHTFLIGQTGTNFTPDSPGEVEYLIVAGGGGGGANHAGGGGARSCYIELQNPFLSVATEMRSRVRYGSVYGTEIGHTGSTTSFTSFKLTPASGTMSNGTIYVYGYRKA